AQAPLKISSTAAGSEDYLLVSSSGRIGIGTASPSFQMEMKGTGNVDGDLGIQIINTNTNGDAITRYINDTGVVGWVGMGGSSQFVAYGSRMNMFTNAGMSLVAGNDIWFYTGGNNVATFDGAGNLGI